MERCNAAVCGSAEANEIDAYKSPPDFFFFFSSTGD
jgi:hypothetical protein